MPLTQKVTFKTILQKYHRVQIPKIIRWQFKMEVGETFRIGISSGLERFKFSQFFYAKMTKDGRILIPELTMSLLQKDKPSLEGSILEVTLEPVDSSV